MLTRKEWVTEMKIPSKTANNPNFLLTFYGKYDIITS